MTSQAPQISNAEAKVGAAEPSAVLVDPLGRFKSIDWNESQPAGAEELSEALVNSAELRNAALARYRQEPAGRAKNNLKFFLTIRPLPEIMAIATQWAQQADSAITRTDGFRLLGQMGGNPAVYALARQALEFEKDQEVLSAAIWILSPPQQGVIDPVEVDWVVPRLHELTKNPYWKIREASIQRLPEWDKAQKYVVQDVVRLLSDPEYEVRLSATGASSITYLTADSIKQRFISILADTKESEELRSIILLHLDRFGLNAQEYAIYKKVQSELSGVQDAGASQ